MKRTKFLALIFAVSGFRLIGAESSSLAPAVPEGYTLIEGDILRRISIRPNATTFESSPTAYWSGGIVPYEFDVFVVPENRTKMLGAMSEWEAVAHIRFRPRADETDFVFIRNSTANNSEVGRQGGLQIINITSWDSRFRMAHELAHSLGFWHEQSRPDRDNFIRIETNNIESTKRFNFEPRPDARVYGPYDFGSIMHYDACDFSVCDNCTPDSQACRSITVLPPWAAQWQTGIGQRGALSVWDARNMSFLYPEPDWRFVDPTHGSLGSGTFLNPFQLLASAVADVPEGGTIWLLQPVTYLAGRTLSKKLILRAPLGGAVLVP